MNIITIKNNQTIPLASIPHLAYEQFFEQNSSLLEDLDNHIVNYYGYPQNGHIQLICCVANDAKGDIYISSAGVDASVQLPSFSNRHPAAHIFERELHESFGLNYTDHPWLKPVRYAFNRADATSRIENYPFYKIASDELHEVGVGPIHAGIIEPGHFRFICNGEQILHLEIQLGFQHRGIEDLLLKKKSLLQRSSLIESVSGDSVAGHSVAFVNLWESLCQYEADEDLKFARTVALEVERIAIHTGDLSAMCIDIAYQIGSAVLGRLRTPLVNFFQDWSGNRFAKGLIRAGKSNFPFTEDHGQLLNLTLDNFTPAFDEIISVAFKQPSVLSRLERTGIVSRETAIKLGTVGMVARSSGFSRDIRSTHPHDLYERINHVPAVKHHGDDYSRAQIREEEIVQSIGYIKNFLENIPKNKRSLKTLPAPLANSFSISLVEGWRGEICHCAITDANGDLLHYKIKDPSLHNWLALARSVRNNEISDFPICNKSFNLSYCGHDL